MSTRTMYDGVTVASVPSGGDLYASYVSGHYENAAAMRAAHPGARHVGIATVASHVGTDAQVLDVERGDATPAQAPVWVRTQRARGVDPTVYCNASTWPEVKREFAKQGVSLPHFWIAHYGAPAVIPAGAVALQYLNRPGYDESVVAAYWPGVDPKPVPALPKVSLAHVVAAAEHDPGAPQGHALHAADVRPVEAALVAEGLLAAEWAKDGAFGSKTINAYAAWQRREGYEGKDANGIPGIATLKKLGAKHGFIVTK